MGGIYLTKQKKLFLLLIAKAAVYMHRCDYHYEEFDLNRWFKLLLSIALEVNYGHDWCCFDICNADEHQLDLENICEKGNNNLC